MLHYQFADGMVAGPVIAEMQPIWRGGAGILYAIVIFAVVGCALWRRQRLRVGERLWILIGVLLVLQLGRYAPLFALLAVPSFAATMPRMSDRVLGRPLVYATIALAIGLGVSRVCREFPDRRADLSQWLNRHGPDTPGYPCAATDFVARNVAPARGRLINEFTWGGYLEWRLGDRYQVLLDGRTQLYSSQFWQATYLGDDEQRKSFLARVDADAAVLPLRGSRFAGDLRGLGWTTIYTDDRAAVMVPPAASVASGADH
jgi:hypothetical protein